MKNTLKLLGIAIAVVLTFGLVGCGPIEEEEDEPSVILSATGESYSAPGITAYYDIGTIITATIKNPSSTETAWFDWFKTDINGSWNYNAPLDAAGGTGASADRITTSKTTTLGEGMYRVIVKYGDKETKPSNIIIVKEYVPGEEPPGDEFDYDFFVGTWKYEPTEALSDTSTRGTLQQLITITEDQFKITEPNTTDSFTFRVDSWWVRSFTANKNGIAAIPTSADVASREGWSFSNGNSGDFALSKYTEAFPNVYELNGARTAFSGQGYNSTPTKFFLLINDAKTKFVRTSIAVSGTVTSITSCVYVKQAAE